MIRFALHLRYTSLQSYKLVLEKFPLPSISTLHRIQAGGVDSLKIAKKLREKGHISCDIILMVDEMFLQKEASYQSGDYVGEDEEGDLYYSYNIVQAHGVMDVRAAYTQIFDRFSPQIDIC